MPASASAKTQTVDVPYSEAAIHCGVAGLRLEAVEEDLYVNGVEIPERRRTGCFVFPESDSHGVPLLKSEAGWTSERG
jgi:hypothetical protein